MQPARASDWPVFLYLPQVALAQSAKKVPSWPKEEIIQQSPYMNGGDRLRLDFGREIICCNREVVVVSSVGRNIEVVMVSSYLELV